MQKTAELRNKISKLAAAPTVSDQDFAEAVYDALAITGISEDSFRDHFGLTKDAVHRWTQGQSLPQPMIRGKVLGWILAQLPGC